MSNDEPPNSILTKKQRERIREGFAEDIDRGMRHRIRHRLRAGMMDFHLLTQYFQEYPDDIEAVFGDTQEFRRRMRSGEVPMQVEDPLNRHPDQTADAFWAFMMMQPAMAVFYLASGDENTYRQMVTMGIIDGEKHRGWDVSVNVDIDIDYRERIDSPDDDTE